MTPEQQSFADDPTVANAIQLLRSEREAPVHLRAKFCCDAACRVIAEGVLDGSYQSDELRAECRLLERSSTILGSLKWTKSSLVTDIDTFLARHPQT